MKWALLFHLVLACLFLVKAQKETTTDANGQTVVVSFSTDQLGETLATSVLSTIGSSTTKQSTTSLSEPTQTGTALPPFSSIPVSSGTVIAYSDYTHTGLPSNYPKKGSAKSLHDLCGFVCSAIAALGGLIGGVVLL